MPFFFRWLLAALVILGNYGHFSAQPETQGLVNWMSFKEAQEKNKQVEKPFIIDIYTDWCGWCKHMMRTTYSNPGIADYINRNFYPVKFDAEGKDTLEYDGKIYKPTSPNPRTPHELAIKFLGNGLSYPSTVFVTNKFQYTLLSQGYMDEKKFEPLLVFMVENAWRSATYDQFNAHFQHSFYDTAFPKGKLKKYKVEELESLVKKKSKKALVLINAGFCNTGKVMSLTTFNDTSLVKYLDKHFYFSELEVTRSDSVMFKHEKYGQVLVNNFPMNSLALKLSNNQLTLPTLCILDEQLNTIQVLNFYQAPENLYPVLRYFGTDAYKKQAYPEFIQAEQQKGKKP
ncbi:MAG TPA: DUF255 domain-containing protein [Bacteroidia bacterium]|nr:DUF255 domain-containing protein [Bacteroidia bacterium]